MNKNLRLSALTLLWSLALTSCGGDDSGTAVAPAPPSDRPASVERDLSPVTIDPLVDTSTEAHVAINPSASVAPTDKLFVFLPGTEGTPNMYRLILRSGAGRGFHTLGLNYPNPTPVGLLCNNSGDADCFWNVRREIVTGVDTSALVDISDANSIVTRLTKAISYLHQTYPTEGWGQFLASGAIDWSKVRMAGHSQGGGHAGVMAKIYSMDRSAYFGSPADWSSTYNAPAAWTSASNVTPTARQFGFAHLQDPLVPYSELSVIWQSMGLAAFGSAVSVDSNAAPFGGSHMLATEIVPNLGGSVSPYHGSTVLDAATPIAGNGVPVFDSVWAYLCFQ